MRERRLFIFLEREQGPWPLFDEIWPHNLNPALGQTLLGRNFWMATIDFLVCFRIPVLTPVGPPAMPLLGSKRAPPTPVRPFAQIKPQTYLSDKIHLTFEINLHTYILKYTPSIHSLTHNVTVPAWPVQQKIGHFVRCWNMW